MAELETFKYTIGGVSVRMPVRPYASQVSMIDKVIRACQKNMNCLLESPTGSGKTLALLCSALAWQEAEKDRLEKLCDEEFNTKLQEWMIKSSESEKNKKKFQKTKSADTINTVCSVNNSEEDDEMSVFKLPSHKKKKFNCSSNSSDFNNSVPYDDSIMTDDDTCSNSLITDDEDENCVPEQPVDTKKPPTKSKPVVPIIYFCTRTHKQIEQVIKELQRTSYNNVRSCVLASREHTCIQDSNVNFPYITYKSKTEMCKDLMDPKARRRNSLKYKGEFDRCLFYDNGGVRIGTYNQLARSNISSVWDVEDLVKLGKKQKSCPYYATRMLLKSANIVFCPYNYIIDPVIRKTMNVKLQGHVIIVDEAHNIEDQCREAASLRLDQSMVNLAKMDCEKMSKLGQDSISYAALARYLSDLSKWIDKKSDTIKSFDDFNRGVVSWSGMYTIASFEDFDIGLVDFEKFKKHYETVLGAENEKIETDNDKGELDESMVAQGAETTDKSSQNEDSTITNATSSLLTSICMVFTMFFDEKYKTDYHVSLEKLMHTSKYEQDKKRVNTVASWIDADAEPASGRPVWNSVVSFLCLNPAAVFDGLKTAARTIVLTSGTLSPMQSFQSELGTQFPIALEANHVIKHDQCWVTTVSAGPTRVDLDGQYRNASTYAYQDEMGRVLAAVCRTVPYGVLCFVPSYAQMDKLYDRWRLTGVLDELSRTKKVLCEPRRGDRLEGLMDAFYLAVRQASGRRGDGGKTGALFLAVYRGKISEGLDFSDNFARAVVAIGIPFPNIKDVAVNYKKEYNNQHAKSKGLLPGWSWYEIQAYRALNQALGRCIRHRNDWGAILLVDSRYTQSKNITGLSKWIRGRVEHNNWTSIEEKLKHFVEIRQLEDCNV